MSGNTTRILMYVIVLVIGVIVAAVGFTRDAATEPVLREWLIGLGAAAVIVAIYAWARGLGPVGSERPGEPAGGPGFRFELWPDGIVILAIIVVCVVVSILIF